MQPILRRAFSSEFFRHNLIYAVGAFGVSVVNYLFYPVIGRLMQPADFGEVQTIISFFLQAGIFLQVLGFVTIGITRKYDDMNLRERMITTFSQISFQIGLVICILLVIASPWLKTYFQFVSLLPFLALAVSLLISVPGAFANANLQADKRFAALATSGLIASVGKLIISSLLVLAGLKAFGAIGGIVVAQALALIYATKLGTRGFARLKNDITLRRPSLVLIRPELKFAGLVLCASLTINVLLSLDAIVVKHLFSPQIAGEYAGISTIARIIFFISGPLTMVLIPQITPGRNVENLQYLVRSLCLSVVVGGICLIVFSTAPELVITTLLGHKYLTYSHLLPRLSLAIYLLSLCNMLVYFSVASRYLASAVITLASLVLGIVLISTMHATIAAVINDLIITALVLGVLLAGRIIIEPRRALA